MWLALKLFGSPTISDAQGNLIRLPTRKSEGLLHYLIERDGAEVSREVVADLLWPLSGPEQARASLRQELSVLRKGLGPEYGDRIFSGSDRMSFDCTQVQTDLAGFRACAADPKDLPTLVQALGLYSGPFLDTVRIRSQPFSDWVWTTRQSLEATALSLGSDALKLALQGTDKDQTTEIAQHLTRIDPTFEFAHRALIQVYLDRGDADLAKRQFAQCSEALKTKLDAEPSDETLQLAALLDAPRPGGTPVQPAAPTLRQRRPLTFLSVLADIPDSDPELFDAQCTQMADYLSQLAGPKGGFVFDSFHGRVLISFGYPNSHGREADAALGLGFEVQEAVSLGRAPFASCQIGLSQGMVLVADGAGAKAGFVGAPIRAADSLSRRAAPGMILVDASIKDAASPAYPLSPSADHPGMLQAIDPHSGRLFDGFDTSTSTSHDLIGRDTSLAHATAVLAAAQAGTGAAATIIGNAGEGKSRLVQDVALEASDQGLKVLIFRGVMGAQQSAFSPLIDQMLRAGGGAERHKNSIRQGLQAQLAPLGPEFDQVAFYLDELHSSTDAQTPNNPASSAKETRDKALDVFAALAETARPSRPVLFVFEDAQWFDPSTCEAIGRLIDSLEDTPASVLITTRPDQSPEVLNHPLIQQIQLAPLDPASAETLLRGLLAPQTVDAATLTDVLAKAQGNPLMIEEFAKTLVHQSDQSLMTSAEGAIGPIPGPSAEGTAPPDRLLPLLLSRIDSMPGAIQVLQHAAVLGRRFRLADLSQMLHPLSVEMQLLHELEAEGIIFAVRRGDNEAYIFKHALTRDAIYSTIPLHYRTELHHAAATILLSAGTRLDHAQVARHFRAAGTHDTAARHFEAAADRSVSVAAHAEAIADYQDALHMVSNLPLSHYRMQRELTLNRKIAAQFIALRGIPTFEAAPYYEATGALSQELADFEETVNAAWGLWSIHLMDAQMDTCLTIAQTLTADIPPNASLPAKVIAAYMQGVTHAYRGSLAEAVSCLENVQSMQSDDMTTDLQSRFGMDIALTSDSFLAWVYALQGNESCADAVSARAMAKAERNSTPLNLVFAHVFGATKSLFLNQLDQAEAHSQIALKGAQEMGYTQWIAQANLQLARVADLRGEPGALEDMQAAIDAYLAAKMVLATPYALVWVAEALIHRKDLTQALETLDRLQEFTDRTQENYFQPQAQAARRKIEDSFCYQ